MKLGITIYKVSSLHCLFCLTTQIFSLLSCTIQLKAERKLQLRKDCELIIKIHRFQTVKNSRIISCLFCSTNSLQHKDIQFTSIYDNERQQIFTIKKPMRVNQSWKIVADWFFVSQWFGSIVTSYSFMKKLFKPHTFPRSLTFWPRPL